MRHKTPAYKNKIRISVDCRQFSYAVQQDYPRPSFSISSCVIGRQSRTTNKREAGIGEKGGHLVEAFRTARGK